MVCILMMMINCKVYPKLFKVCMDRNSPEYYCETTQDSLQETKQFIKQVF